MKLRSTLLFAAASLTASALAPVVATTSAFFVGSMVSVQANESLDANTTTVITGETREFADGVTGHSLGLTNGAIVTISGGTSLFTGGVVGLGDGSEWNSVLVFDSELNITGGSLNAAENKAIGIRGGDVNQSGGTVNATYIRLNDAFGSSTPSVYNLSGGVLNLNSTTTGNVNNAGILLGHWGNGKGVLSVSKTGVLNAENTWAVVSWTSPGEFNISGGEVNIKGVSLAGQWGASASASLTLSGDGRLNVGAGGLNTGNTTQGVKAYNLNGGTLGALDSWTASAPLNIGGSVTVDTTKHVVSTSGASSAATGDSAGATITLGNLAFTGAGALTLEGAGTVVLNGTISGVSTDDSVAKITLSSGTLQFGDGFVYALTGTDDSIAGKSLKIATVSGGSVSYDSLDVSNFTWNGSALASRTHVSVENGVATFSGAAYNLFWKGGAAGTWDTTTATTFGKDSVTGEDTAFVAGDNVTFNTSGDVAVTVNEAITAGTMTISDGNVSISGSGNVSAKETIVSGTGTLNLGSYSNTSQSYLRGALTIKNGGTVNFTGNDASGWGGGTTAISALKVEKGGELYISTTSNQTFNMSGGIVLQGGKISGIEGAKFDLYNASTGIQTLASDATAEIATKIGMRRTTGVFDVAAGTTENGVDLLLSGGLTSTNDGSISLIKRGDGTLKITGDSSGFDAGATIEAGKVIVASDHALGTGSLSVTSGATLVFELGENTVFTQGENQVFNGDAGAGSNLVISSGKVILTRTNNFKGIVDIQDGGILELGASADLLGGIYTKGARLYVREGGELRLDNFQYTQLNGSPDYAVHRILDGGKISITGGSSESGMSFTVSKNGGSFVVEQSSATVALVGNGNSSIVVLEEDGVLKLGGAGNLTINKYGERVAISGQGGLEKVGTGTLTLNCQGNTFSGGVKVSEGTLVIKEMSVLGSSKRVTLNGGVLKGESASVVIDSGAEVVVSSSGSSLGTITLNGGTISYTENVSLALLSDATLTAGTLDLSRIVFDEDNYTMTVFTGASDAVLAVVNSEEITKTVAGTFSLSNGELVFTADEGARFLFWDLAASDQTWDADSFSGRAFSDGKNVLFSSVDGEKNVGITAPVSSSKVVVDAGDAGTYDFVGSENLTATEIDVRSGTLILNELSDSNTIGAVSVQDGASLVLNSDNSGFDSITLNSDASLVLKTNTAFRNAGQQITGGAILGSGTIVVDLTDKTAVLNHDLEGIPGAISNTEKFTGVVNVKQGTVNFYEDRNAESNAIKWIVENGGRILLSAQDGAVNLVGGVTLAGSGISEATDDVMKAALAFSETVSVSANVVLSDDATIYVAEGKTGTFSEGWNSNGHTLTITGPGALHFGSSSNWQTAGSRFLFDSVSLASGATIGTIGAGYLFDNLILADSGSATLRLWDTNGVSTQTVGIKNLSGKDATLNLVSTVKMNGGQYAVFTLGDASVLSENGFNGKIVFSNTTSSGNRKASLILANKDIAKNAEISLTESSAHTLGLGINVSAATIGGLSSTDADHRVFSGAANENLNSDSTRRTLEIGTAENTEYTFYGQILNNLNLVKSGAGTQVLAGSSASFDGAVSVTGGSLVLKNGQALGSIGVISVTGESSVLSLSTTETDTAESFVFANSVSGTGTLKKEGAGVAKATGALSVSNLDVSTGTLVLGADNSVGGLSGTGTLEGDTSERTLSLTGTANKTFSGTIKNLNITTSGTQTFADVKWHGAEAESSYAGTLKVAAGTLTMSGENSGFAGKVEMAGGEIAGTLQLGAGATLTASASGATTIENLTLAGGTVEWTKLHSEGEGSTQKQWFSVGTLNLAGTEGSAISFKIADSLTPAGAGGVFTTYTLFEFDTIQNNGTNIASSDLSGKTQQDLFAALGGNLKLVDSAGADYGWGNIILKYVEGANGSKSQIQIYQAALAQNLHWVGDDDAEGGWTQTDVWADDTETKQTFSSMSSVTLNKIDDLKRTITVSGVIEPASITVTGGDYTLKLADDATEGSTIKGSANLYVSGGTLTVDLSNTFNGGTQILAGATVNIGADAALGVGEVQLAGTLNFKDGVTEFANALSDFDDESVGVITKVGDSVLTLSGNRSQFTGTLDVEAGTVVLANGTGTEAFSRINIAEGATVSATSGAAVSGFNTLTLGMVSGTGTLIANSQGSGFYALDLSGSDFEGVVELNGADAVLARNPNEAHVTSVSNFANAKAVRLTNGAALTFFNEAIAFDTDIEVAVSDGAIRVYGNNTGATIAGAVSGTGTLTVKDGGAVKFTGGMELGTLSVASASSVEISGGDANLGALVSSSASTALIVGGNVSVADDFTASGFGSITLTESGHFTTTGDFTSRPGDGKTMSVVGAGTSSLITAQVLDVGGSGTTSFESVRIDVANGIVVGSDLLLKDVVLGVAEGSDGWRTSVWGMKLNGGSTTFDVAAGKEITVNNPLTEAVAQSGTEGKDGYVAGTSSELIKTGAGTLVFEAVNAHKGGTTINEGVLKFTNTNGIDLGDTAYAFNGGALAAGASTTVSVGAGTAFSGNVILTSDRNGKFLFTEDFSYTEGFTLDAGAAAEIADGKTLTLSSLAFTNAGSTVSGDGTLALAGTLTAANNRTNTISSNFTLAADSTINVVSGTVVLSGEDVSAKGFALTKTGAGTLKFGSDAVYDFEGSFLIQGGTVDLDGRDLTIANGSVFGLHGAVLKGNLVLDGGTAELGGGTSKIDGNVSIENTSLTFGGKVTGIGELTWGDGNTISLTDAFRATLSGTGTLLDFDSAKDANGNALSADTDFGDIIDGSAFLGRDVELVYNADNTTLDIAVTGALQWNTGVAYWIQTATMSEIELPKWDLVTKTGVVEKSEIFTAGKFVEFNRAGSVTLVGRANGYTIRNGAIAEIHGSGTINTAGMIFNIADGGNFTLNAAENGDYPKGVSLVGAAQTDTETGTTTNVDDGITILAGNIVIAKEIDNRLKGGMRIFGGSLTVSDEKALGDGTVTLGDASSASSATLTFNETTEVGQTVYVGNTAAIIGVNNEKTVTVEKALEKDASATAAALTKQGAGTLVIQRETALDGITVSGGTLRLAGEGDSDLGTTTFTVNSGATLEVGNGSGTGANTSFESLALNGTLKVGGDGAFRAGTISATGAGSVFGDLYVGGETSFTDGENNTYAGTALSVDANATLSIGDVESYGDTGAALYKIGAGTLTLGGNIGADFVHDAGTVVFAENLSTEKNYTVSGSGRIRVNSDKTATFAGGFTSDGYVAVTLNTGASATFNGFSAADAVTVFSATDNRRIRSVSITGGTENSVALGTVYVGGLGYNYSASGLISLSVEADNVSAETIVLGAGSSLTLAAGGATAKSLYIENWNGLVSTLDLSSGTKLELKNEGDTPSEIQGTGTLKVVGGMLSVTDWTGVSDASPSIILDGATFNVEVDDLSSCSLSALSTTEKGGTFSKSGAGTLSLREGQGADPTKDMEFDGTVAVNEGDLWVYATMSNADVSVGENGSLSVVANVELGDDMVNVNTLAKKLSGAGTLVARGALYANGGLDDFNGKLVVSGSSAALYVSSATETWLGGDVKTRGIGMKNSGTVASLSEAVNLKEVSLDGSGTLYGVLDDADVVSLTVGSVVAASNSSLTLDGAGTLGSLSFAPAEDGASATNTLTAETWSMWTINGASVNLSQVTLNAGSVLVVENKSALGNASVSVGEYGCLKITADGDYGNAITLSDGIVWATGEVELTGDLTADSAATFVAGEEGTAGTLTLSESALSLNSAKFTAATAESKIVISNTDAATLAATLGGAGTFEKTGAGTLTADSTLGSVGTFSVAEGSVVFGSEAQLSAHGETTGTLAVAEDASATINGTNLSDFVLGGDGSVTVSGGTGTLNGMDGATNVSLSGNAALSVVGNVSGSNVAFADGATLKTTGEDSQRISDTTLSGETVTLSNENASVSVVYDSTVELDGTTTLVLDARTGFNGGEFAGVYSGSLEKTGDGKWIVSNYTYGANADEELNVAGGTLEWKNAKIGDNAGEISLGTNATLRVVGLASGDTLHGTLSGDDSTTLEIADTILTLETAAKEGSNWGVKISDDDESNGKAVVTINNALPGSLEVAGTATAKLDLETEEMATGEGDQLIVSKAATLELVSGTLTVGNTSDKMMNTIDGSVFVGGGSMFNQTAGIRWADGSNLTIDGTYAVSYGDDFGNTGWNRATITGTGTLFVMNTAESGYNISGKVSGFTGTLEIEDGAKVNLTGGASFDNAAAIILDGENAVLEVAHNLGGTLNHLSGDGEVVINGDASANNFLTAHYEWGEENNGFTGSVSVRSGALDLSVTDLESDGWKLAVGGDKPARYSESAKAAGISQGAWLRLMTDSQVNIGDLNLGFLKDNGGVIFSGGTYVAGKTFGSDTNQGNLYVVEKDAKLALASGADVNGGLFVAYGSTLELGTDLAADTTALNTNGIGATNNTVHGDFTLNGKLVVEVSDENVDDPLLAVNGTTKIASGGQGVAEIVIDTSGTTEDLSTRDITIVSGYKDTRQNLDEVVKVWVMEREVEVSRDGNGNIVVVSAVNDYTAPSGLQGIYDAIRAAGSSSLWTYLKSDRANSDSLNDKLVALSPVSYGSLAEMQHGFAALENELLRERLEQRRYERAFVSDSAKQFKPFVNVIGSQREGDGDGTASANYDISHVGLIGGFDVAVSRNTIFGVSLGFDRSEADLHAGLGKNKGNGTRLGVYGMSVFDNAYFGYGASAGAISFETKRNSGYNGETLKGETDGNDLNASFVFGAGWTLDQSLGIDLAPYVGLDFGYAYAKAFKEEGGRQTALSVDKTEHLSLRGTIGATLGWRASDNLRISLDASFSHEFLDSDTDIDATFASGELAGTAFSSTAYLTDENTIRVGPRVDYRIDDTWSVSGGYSYETDLDDTVTHSANVGFRARF